MDDGVTTAVFELNNALNVSQVVDAQGKPVQAQRNQADFTVRLNFEQPLPKGQPYSVTFYYDGRLTGDEESPVSGMKFAAIHPGLRLPVISGALVPGERIHHRPFRRGHADHRAHGICGRWAAASIRTRPQGDKNLYEFKFERHSFPGSIAMVKQPPANIQSEGVRTAIYFRGDEAGNGASLWR